MFGKTMEFNGQADVSLIPLADSEESLSKILKPSAGG
jgi:hypothetical protein